VRHCASVSPQLVNAWYFAYGSNMQRATLCERRGIVCQRALAARVPGWQVVFDKPPLIPIGESFANLVPDPNGSAFGVLFEIATEDLAHLDLTEGVLIGNYERVLITAHPLNDADTMVTAHTLTSARRDPSLNPSPRYMGLVIEGATEHSLPADYLTHLRAIPTRAESLQAKLLRPMLDAVMRRR
jgi:hypothetical protein